MLPQTNFDKKDNNIIYDSFSGYIYGHHTYTSYQKFPVSIMSIFWQTALATNVTL